MQTKLIKQFKDKFQRKLLFFSDKITTYVDITGYVEIHITEKSDKKQQKKLYAGFISQLATLN